MDHFGSVGSVLFAVVVFIVTAVVGVLFLVHPQGRRTSRLFGLVLAGISVSWLATMLFDPEDASASSWFRLVIVLGLAAAGGGIVALGLSGLAKQRRRVPWLAVAGLVGAVPVLPYAVWFIADLGSGRAVDAWGPILSLTMIFFMFASTFCVALLALRYPRFGGPGSAWGEHALLSFGLYLFSVSFVLLVAVFTGMFSRGWVTPLSAFVYVVLLTGFWVFNAATEPPASRVARNMAIAVAAVPLLPFLLLAAGRRFFSVVFASGDSMLFFLLGVFFVVGLMLLVYSVLSKDFLGVALRLRWGVSKGLVAGLGLAVFFAITELSKLWLEDVLASRILGVLAVSALVLVFSPIQSLADRVARRAVPAALTGTPVERREEIYRQASRWALRDQALSESEQIQLANLADELGIGAGRAAVLLSETRTALTGDAGAKPQPGGGA